MNQIIASTVARASARAVRASEDLLKSMATRAGEEARQCETRHRRERRNRLKTEHEISLRTQLALRGVNALLELGRSPEFQTLLAVRGGDILLWGDTKIVSPGGDMGDVSWKYVNTITLTRTGLRILNYSATSSRAGFRIDWHLEPFFWFTSYAIDDDLLRLRQLYRIATSEPLDLEYSSRHDREHAQYSTEMLFETLVDCGEQKYFERFVVEAI